MSIQFISAQAVNTRLAQEHDALMDKAIREINRALGQAREFPIKLDIALLTDVVCVQRELIRKLREEAGWHVEFLGDNPGMCVLDTNPAKFFVLHLTRQGVK